MTDTPQVVFVLHAMQPLTTDPAAAIGRPDCEIVVLTTPDAGPALREDVSGADPVIHRADRAAWPEAVERLAGGRRFEVITNDEYCLLDCRDLRAAFGLAPRHPHELAAYLDKALMKRRLNAGGVATARFEEIDVVAEDRAAAERIAARLGLPVVAKPRQEANSRGVSVLTSVDDLVRWQRTKSGRRGWHVEEFLGGYQYHVNGVVRDGVVSPVQVGRYGGPLLDLPEGRRLGAVTLPPEHEAVPIAHALNEAVVAALGGAGAFVVHTEFVLRPDGPAVLEVAARAPGAMVSEAARRHAGVNLETVNLALQAGLEPEPAAWTGLGAGWVWTPVMPGETFRSGPPFAGGSQIHIRKAAAAGHQGVSGVLGSSALFWSADPQVLEADMELALTWDWTR